jgi:hypothetical protein
VSPNPDLRKPGRPSYPEGEGIIAKAWSDKVAALTSLPADRSAWESNLVERGIPADVVSQLKMQSRSIVGRRIDQVGSPQSDPVGIVILESTAARGVGSQTIDRLEKNPVWPVLAAVMANAREHLADIALTLSASSPENQIPPRGAHELQA